IEEVGRIAGGDAREELLRVEAAVRRGDLGRCERLLRDREARLRDVVAVRPEAHDRERLAGLRARGPGGRAGRSGRVAAARGEEREGGEEGGGRESHRHSILPCSKG